ncbi:MAG: hypothetical protein ABS46_12680 [Cytophagaceae bacterium SCN 52-12]|nr:MAG: hypothetical protein ABS46_12680 [Cytophagaceae bacterium SCN 52-12]
MSQITTFDTFSELAGKALTCLYETGSQKKTLFVFFSTVLCSVIAEAAVPPVRITEFMYNGSEFIEFTNAGDLPVDMTGWSFDDDSRVPGSVSLGAFGIIQPGESVILSESPAEEFRAHWNLSGQVKIIGDNDNNLSRNDEINLFDATGALVDRLTFGDQNFPGTPRTHEHSAWVGADALGENNIAGWTLSSSGDAEGSFASTDGQYGSPGKSTRSNALPVTLVSFTATLSETAVDLRWVIADYEEGVVFDIQRSYDGYRFETIHQVPLVSDRHGFFFRDENPAPGRQLLYYRLGVTGKDGKTEFSAIRSVETDRPGEMISLYPNPAVNGALTVKTPEKAAVSLKVYNSLGMEQRRIEFRENTSFETSDWPSGTYLLHFTTRSGQQFRRTLVVIN